MNQHLFTELFTITVVLYWILRRAYCFGHWFGWVTDPEQWPRQMAALLIDIFRWDREVSRVLDDDEIVRATADWKVYGGRAPRGTPEARP